MQKVTVEGCLKYVSNRFELVLLLSHRVHELYSGATGLVESGDKKNTDIALSEMSEGKLDPEVLRNALIERCHKELLGIKNSFEYNTQPETTKSPFERFNHLSMNAGVAENEENKENIEEILPEEILPEVEEFSSVDYSAVIMVEDDGDSDDCDFAKGFSFDDNDIEDKS